MVCDYNQLSVLDVSQNTALTYLACSSNQLTAFDISDNTALTDLYCYYNPGNGETFPVKAWFDNSGIPANFTTGSWDSNGATITIDYRQEF